MKSIKAVSSKPRSQRSSATKTSGAKRPPGLSVKKSGVGHIAHAVMKRSRERQLGANALRPSTPSGYEETPGGLFVPQEHLKPVAPSKIQTGLQKANKAISKMVEEFAKLMTEEYSIKEIEFSVSFDADGKFMGIGVGGSTSIKVRIAPSEQSSIRYGPKQ